MASQHPGEHRISLSAVVMAHPDRKAAAERLRRRHPELDIEIVVDPEPAGPPATLRTARLAWSRVRPGATHQLVLQEDVCLQDGFLGAVTRALALRPAEPVTLFAPWVMETAQAVRLAALAGASWTPSIDQWIPTQALVLPAPLAEEFAGQAARYPDWMPDNRAMKGFLDSKKLVAQVLVPSIVEHRPVPSLLLNDLIHGVREATVFADAVVGDATVGDRTVAPAAIAQLGFGGGLQCQYQPLVRDTASRPMPAIDLLLLLGMSQAEVAGSFAADLGRHRGAETLPFGDSFLFQLWLTTFIQGVLARELLPAMDPRDLPAAVDAQPWARPALATFPAAVLRQICRPESIRSVAADLAPFCLTALASGFAAPDSWPDLTLAGHPDRNAIRPQWDGGVVRGISGPERR